MRLLLDIFNDWVHFGLMITELYLQNAD